MAERARFSANEIFHEIKYFCCMRFVGVFIGDCGVGRAALWIVVMFLRSFRVFVALLLVAAAPFLFLAACQSQFIYMPRGYPESAVADWKQDSGGRALDFTTSQGRQRAFLQGNLESPRNLWIVCGGNATRALDWSPWLLEHAPSEDAWLLVDFPGYGESEGRPTPARIRESFQKVVPIAAESVGFSATPDPARLRVFGHSLGAAACLIAASEFDIRGGVLLSPFTSTMEMSRRVVGVPLGFLVTHRFDNAARLDEILAAGPANFIILHGSHDEVIPVQMGRELTETRLDHVSFIEIEGGRHNDIAHRHPGPLANALKQAGSTGQR